MNGAYSVLPGTYDAIRAVGRGVGLMGPEAYRRFGQEADFVGNMLTRAAEHPRATLRTVGDVFSALNRDPLFKYYMTGRAAMGLATGLGGAAAAGGALRAIENGHN